MLLQVKLSKEDADALEKYQGAQRFLTSKAEITRYALRKVVHEQEDTRPVEHQQASEARP